MVYKSWLSSNDDLMDGEQAGTGPYQAEAPPQPTPSPPPVQPAPTFQPPPRPYSETRYRPSYLRPPDSGELLKYAAVAIVLVVVIVGGLLVLTGRIGGKHSQGTTSSAASTTIGSGSSTTIPSSGSGTPQGNTSYLSVGQFASFINSSSTGLQNSYAYYGPYVLFVKPGNVTTYQGISGSLKVKNATKAYSVRYASTNPTKGTVIAVEYVLSAQNLHSLFTYILNNSGSYGITSGPAIDYAYYTYTSNSVKYMRMFGYTGSAVVVLDIESKGALPTPIAIVNVLNSAS